jgi:hypothetical protein
MAQTMEMEEWGHEDGIGNAARMASVDCTARARF